MNIEKIKDALRSLLVECNNIMSDRGNLFYDGEIVVGSTIYSDEEMTTVIEDGDYVTDEKIITITDGKVSDIKDKEPEVEETEETEVEETEVVAEEEITEEPTVEEPTESDDINAEIEALKAEIEALKGVVESILEKVNAPITEPITEEFSKVERPTDKWDRYAQIISDLKK